jgi:hypothetical protein
MKLITKYTIVMFDSSYKKFLTLCIVFLYEADDGRRSEQNVSVNGNVW